MSEDTAAMRTLFGFNSFTPDELTRLCWLRAVEWLAWPAFLSQPLLPILYIFYSIYMVWIAVFLVGLLWLPIRYNFVNLQLAALGAFWVRLKWVTIPIGVFVLFRQGRYTAVAVALLTAWITGLLNFPGKVGVVQQKFLESAL